MASTDRTATGHEELDTNVCVNASALAEEIADNAPLAVQLTKAALYQSLTLTPESALQLAASFQGIAQNTADHLGGVDAILARRAPEFKGE